MTSREYSPQELRDLAEGDLLPAPASHALRFVAELFELAADDRYSAELIGIRVRNQLGHL